MIEHEGSKAKLWVDLRAGRLRRLPEEERQHFGRGEVTNRLAGGFVSFDFGWNGAAMT